MSTVLSEPTTGPRSVPCTSSSTVILKKLLCPGAFTLPVTFPVTSPVTLPVYSAATASLPASRILVLLLLSKSPIKPVVDSTGILESNACLALL